jgi:hypothetical protein
VIKCLQTSLCSTTALAILEKWAAHAFSQVSPIDDEGAGFFVLAFRVLTAVSSRDVGRGPRGFARSMRATSQKVKHQAVTFRRMKFIAVKGRATDVDAGFFDILDHTQFPKGLFQLAAPGERVMVASACSPTSFT